MADLVITLVEGSSPNVDNFNIYGEPGDHLLASGVTRSDLATGYYIGGVDTNTYPTIRVASTGTCTTSVDHDVFPAVTPTPTAGVIYNQIQVASGTAGSNGTACQNAQSLNFTASVYHETDIVLVDGHTYLTSSGTPYPGGNGYFSDGTVVGRISNTGLFTQETSCGGI